ncbi:MAG TPA: tripartite tricarboxylate transporter substrate binding protein [Burkholderiales bacterium]|jgi:tripartite-type tricarboxylate transporter receptor subunit TctC
MPAFPLRALAGACLLTLLCHAAGAAEAYPAHPVQVVVPFPPGGNIDVSARVISQAMGQALGQPLVIDNRAGAGGTIGATTVVKSKPDGYTLLVAGSTVSIAPYVYKNVPYDPTRDLIPIGGIQTVPMVLTAAPKTPVTNLADLRAYSRTKGGHVSVGTSGAGSAPHLALEQIVHDAHVALEHVPYKGGAPALTDLLGSQIDMMVDQLNTSLQYIRDGRIKAVAQLGRERSPLIANVPTLAEQGVPGFDVVTYVGVFAPAGVAPDVQARLVGALAAALAKPEVKKQFSDMGAAVFQMNQAQFKAFVAADIAKSKAIAASAHIIVE